MQPALVGLSRAIHDQPELCFEEVRAARRVADMLAEAGFDVERGAYGLDHGRPRPRWGRARCRSSSAPSTTRFPPSATPAGTTSSPPRHWARAWPWPALADDLGLTVTVLGTPAEEGGGGKVLLLERGAFDGAHAAMMVHPWPEDRLVATCLAVDHFEVHYTGRAAHASASPEQGVNAADAMVVAQVAIGLSASTCGAATRSTAS